MKTAAFFPQFQSSTNPKIAYFLSTIDRVSDALGTSVPPIVNLDELRSLPLGTFGRAWADSLDQHNLQPFTTGFRRKQLHDGVHVLTGYGTDPIGETEVQAFLLGAKFHPIHILLGLGLLRPLLKQLQPHLSTDLVQSRLWQAYQRGHRSQLDVDTWQPELMWNLPLSQVKSLAGIQDC
jgi:ubiquinone biosynthesis protein COQ4